MMAFCNLLVLLIVAVPGITKQDDAGEISMVGRVDVSDGPLLLVIQPDEKLDCEVAYIVDPVMGGNAKRFLTTPGNIQFLKRVGKSRIIAYSYPSIRDVTEGYFLLDLAAGTSTQLLPDAPFETQLLGVEGHMGYFLEHQEKRSWTNGEIKAGAVVPRVIRPTDRLFAVNFNGDLKPVALFDQIINTVVQLPADRFWVGTPPPESAFWRVAADGAASEKVLDGFVAVVSVEQGRLWIMARRQGPELWEVIANKGTARKFATLDASWEIGQATCKVSPDGSYVALGFQYAIEKPGQCHMAVFEMKNGKRIRDIPDIFVSIRPDAKPTKIYTMMGGHEDVTGPSPSALSFEWLDHNTIRYSKSEFAKEKIQQLLADRDPSKDPVESAQNGVFVWVDVDIRNGRVLREQIYGSIQSRGGFPPSHCVPVADKEDAEIASGDETDGTYFRGDGISRLSYAGESPQIFELVDPKTHIIRGSADVSDDGAWAMIFSENAGKLWIVDGKKRTKNVVLRRWCHGFHWLPGVR